MTVMSVLQSSKLNAMVFNAVSINARNDSVFLRVVKATATEDWLDRSDSFGDTHHRWIRSHYRDLNYNLHQYTLQCVAACISLA